MQNSYSNKINFKHYRFAFACFLSQSRPNCFIRVVGEREATSRGGKVWSLPEISCLSEISKIKKIYICWYINLYMCVYKSVFIVNIKVTWGNSYFQFSVLLPVFIVFIKRTFWKILNCLLIHNWIDMHLFDKLTVSDLRVTVIKILLLKAEEKPTPEQLIIMEQIKSLYQF